MKYICKHCNGQGVTEKYTELKDIKNGRIWQRTKLCIHCMGKGYLDWIENITGPDRSNAQVLIQNHPSTKWGSFDQDEGEVKYDKW